jgi:hypothetical protein
MRDAYPLAFYFSICPIDYKLFSLEFKFLHLLFGETYRFRPATMTKLNRHYFIIGLALGVFILLFFLFFDC